MFADALTTDDRRGPLAGVATPFGGCLMIDDELNRLVDPSLTEREKDRIISDAAAKLTGLCARIARRHAKYPGLVWSRDGDDLTQLVNEQALLRLRRIAAEGSRSEVNFEVQLNSLARGAIRDFADSGENTMIARGGAAHRRARVDVVRREMNAQLTAEPEKPETSDLTTVLFDNDVESISMADASGHLEMQGNIDRTLAACARHESPVLLAVAIEMFSGFPNGGVPTAADIARLLLPALYDRKTTC